MRCYYVLVHGSFDWRPSPLGSGALGTAKPAGFYAHRYVLAADEAGAADAALRRVRANIDRQFGWLRDGLATVQLYAEEVAAAPLYKLLKADNRGHTFYTGE